MMNKYISVYTLNKYLKAKFDQDLSLQKIYIKGEISNYRPHPSGHLYFTLKDEKSRVNAIMFASQANKLPFQISNGMQVLVTASVSVYEASGQYQIYVQTMSQDGIGDLYLRFEQLKEKLRKEHLFDEEFKRPIPKYPRKIAVLSAKNGAALQDVIRTIALRFPFTQVIVFPIPVQGKDAYLHIVHILKQVDQLHFDTIILARGGGSIEDLWNFNEEELVRCIFACQTPIITGIGHETDFTICDFVSDCRGATPTAAAVLATPDQHELKIQNQQLFKQLHQHMHNKLMLEEHRLKRLSESYFLKNPEYYISNEIYVLEQLKNRLSHQFDFFYLHNEQNIEKLKERLTINIQNQLQNQEHHFQKLVLKLDVLSPLKLIERGYVMVYKDNEVIKHSRDLNASDMIDIQFDDGKVKAKIIK